jgi:hypothetical protein
MGKAFIRTIKTIDGKFVGQVRSLASNAKEVAHYESPEYYTREMAQTAAKCWKEFHMTEEPKTPAREYTIYEDDKVYESGALQNTGKVIDFIGRTINDSPHREIVKCGELGGMFTGYEGFVLEICIGDPKSKMRGNWRRFTVIKANQK